MFTARHSVIKYGDYVVMYTSAENMSTVMVKKDDETRNRFGQFLHNDMVGLPYGSKLLSTSKKGFVFLLKPSPELWTKTLPHRTQIVYHPDISFISQYLDFRPGSRVIEAGTGSGSFSHAISRTIGFKGRLYTFEYHKFREEMARKEFEEHGLTNIIIQHRDVIKEGFGLENEVDSVFLDLPAPWDALPHVVKAIRKDRLTRICCFSPCMEQVQRAVIALADHGFTDIKMFETLIKRLDLYPKEDEPRMTVADAAKRVLEIKARKRALRPPLYEQEGQSQNNNLNESDVDAEEPKSTEDEINSEPDKDSSLKRKRKEHDVGKKWFARHPAEMRGHTSYLTFATFLAEEPKN